jgi:titin
VLLASVGAVLSYSDPELTNGQIYYYMVSAVNPIGIGPFSNETSSTPMALPSAPENLTASARNAEVALAWNAPTNDGGSPITNYSLYRGTTSGSESLL